MAATDFGSFSGMKKKVWAARGWKAGRDRTVLLASGQGLFGTDDNKPLHNITELTETERGHQCVMHLINDLTGDGTPGDDELDGNEEAIVIQDTVITTDLLRHGVRNQGKMSEQKTVVRFRTSARDKLGFWLANKLQEMCFLHLAGRPHTRTLRNGLRAARSKLSRLAFAADVRAPSANRTMIAGGVASLSGLSASDKMDWDTLVGAHTLASRANLKPIMYRGKETYLAFLAPEQLRDLKKDEKYNTNVAQGAPRGEKNPLFTGAAAHVDGLILYSHNQVPTNYDDTTGWGAGNDVEGAQALFLGAQALGVATIGDSQWAEDKQKDYGNKPGISIGRKIGLKKPVFEDPVTETDEDFSVVSIFTAAAKT